MKAAGWAYRRYSIEREVVSGHAYAIPASCPDLSGRCEYDTPTQSVDGVKPVNPGPRCFGTGALDHDKATT